MNKSASNFIPTILREGQVIAGPMFRQPMRVLSVESDGEDAWIVWLAGTHAQQSRCIRVDRDELASFSIIGNLTEPVTNSSTNGCMTTIELLEVLAQEYPNGVSFDPMALRLLRQKIPIDDRRIEDLKAKMFQLGNGLWYTAEMISDAESRDTFQELATNWLKEYGCFSVNRLHERFSGTLHHIASPDDFAVYLRYLGFRMLTWGQSFFCFQYPPSLNEHLMAIAKTIAERLEEVGGTLAVNEIEETMPHLTAKALEDIRAQFLHEVHAMDVGGVPCWRSEDAIHLPDDFAEKLTDTVDTLVTLKEKVSAANLEFALSLFYRIHFREEYALTDNSTFLRVCAKYYQGGNNVFSNRKKPRIEATTPSVPGMRVRNPNTRFCNLGVPIGAELVFTKDSHITCTVRDDSNLIEYEGKVCAISALAGRLLGWSAANGFNHFSYEGETLWERRLRLDREGKQDESPAADMPPPAGMRGAQCEIIDMEEQSLSPATLRLYKNAGTSSRVAEWAHRVENGESEEKIASENNLMVSSVKEYLRSRRRYREFCEKNGIVPEGGANV